MLNNYQLYFLDIVLKNCAKYSVNNHIYKDELKVQKIHKMTSTMDS